jgi:hypothetical protein
MPPRRVTEIAFTSLLFYLIFLGSTPLSTARYYKGETLTLFLDINSSWYLQSLVWWFVVKGRIITTRTERRPSDLEIGSDCPTRPRAADINTRAIVLYSSIIKTGGKPNSGKYYIQSWIWRAGWWKHRVSSIQAIGWLPQSWGRRLTNYFKNIYLQTSCMGVKVRGFFRLRNANILGFYYLFNCYMFRSYDHLHADIYLLELTLLTTDPDLLHSKKPYSFVSGTLFRYRLSKLQGVARPEGLGKLKKINKKLTSPGLEPATFRLVAYRLNHNATACREWL